MTFYRVTHDLLHHGPDTQILVCDIPAYDAHTLQWFAKHLNLVPLDLSEQFVSHVRDHRTYLIPRRDALRLQQHYRDHPSLLAWVTVDGLKWSYPHGTGKSPPLYRFLMPDHEKAHKALPFITLTIRYTRDNYTEDQATYTSTYPVYQDLHQPITNTPTG